MLCGLRLFGWRWAGFGGVCQFLCCEAGAAEGVQLALRSGFVTAKRAGRFCLLQDEHRRGVGMLRVSDQADRLLAEADDFGGEAQFLIGLWRLLNQQVENDVTRFFRGAGVAEEQREEEVEDGVDNSVGDVRWKGRHGM